jgi:hypothetical protein
MITITKKSSTCDVDIKIVQGVTGIHYAINGEELACVPAWERLVSLNETNKIPSKVMIEIASSIINATMLQNKRNATIITDDSVIN